LALAGLACGPSQEEVDQRTQQVVREVLAQIPTATPIVFPTPIPTPTAMPTATPQPRPTPATFPPTPTPITFPASPTPQPIQDFGEVYQKVWPSVFLIETPRGNGSGWLVKPQHILTSQHVVAGLSSVTVRQSIGPAFTASVWAFDSTRDIALLQFDVAASNVLHSDAAPLPLGEITTEAIAQNLMALGYSGIGVWPNGTVGAASTNVGVLSQIIDFGSNSLGLNLVMDVPIDPGDSGGPVLNTDGEVVGMVRAIRERTTGGRRMVGTFYAVHSGEIREALGMLNLGVSR
jgi:S1-C subfamily serine protease